MFRLEDKIKRAFTLAEVLISLVIIGIIAAITVPSVLNTTRKHEYRTALKKAMSVSNGAIARHYALTGDSATDYDTAETFVREVFKSEMNIIPEKTDFTNEVCNGSVVTTTDGMIFCVQNYISEGYDSRDTKCNLDNTIPCAQNEEEPNLWIDINGERKPNKVTSSSINPNDIYQAMIYSRKILPFGTPTEEFFIGQRERENPDTIAAADPTPEPAPDPAPDPTPTPQEPEVNEPDTPSVTPDDIPEDYMNWYDPHRWPSLADFIRWLIEFLRHLLFP